MRFNNLAGIVITAVVLASLVSCNTRYKETELGFKAKIDSTLTEIQFYSPEIVRIVKSKKGFDFEKSSLSVIKEPQKVTFTITKTTAQLLQPPIKWP
jgi:alpha-D-xyloside xylohydrolase